MSTIQDKFCLSNFGIFERGFLPDSPLKRLPGDYFSKWEELVEHLPLLLRDQQVRAKVDRLPDVEFSDSTLQSEAEWQRAYVLLTFLAQAYIWMEGNPEQPLKSVPKKIALPWHHVSEHIGVPPVLTYASVALYNYSLVDPSKPLSVDNLQAITTFLGDPMESWFYMVHTHIEFAAATGLKMIAHAYTAMAQQENGTLAQDLQQISTVLVEMVSIAKRLYEHCRPEFFFNQLVVYFGGSKDFGFIYEGVSSTPQYLRSGSGAQDSAIPAFDIFLGTQHDDKQREVLEDFKKYMPQKHREFLTSLSAQPSVREYVKTSGDAELIKSYNKTVEALCVFRKTHIGIVHSYVIKFLPKEASEEGVKIREFLKVVREDANKLLI